MNVTVAIVGDPGAPISGLRLGPGGDMDVPYDQLPKVNLEVDEHETLGEVLGRACEAVGVELPAGWTAPAIQGVGFIDFFRDDRRPLLGHDVTVLDQDGRVEWVYRWKNVTYGELVRAREEGVLVGDPRRPYLFLQPEIGNGVIVTLVAIYGAWKIVWEVVDNLEKVVKVKDAAKRLLQGRAREVGEVIEAHYEQWQRNGGRPDNLARFLGEHAWSLDHLADVLGCSPAQAEALLLGFGHERGEDDLWRPGTSEEAKFLQDTVQILSTGATWNEDDLRRVLTERAEQFLETGQAPPIDWPTLGGIEHDQDRLEEVNDDHRKTAEERERRWG